MIVCNDQQYLINRVSADPNGIGYAGLESVSKYITPGVHTYNTTRFYPYSSNYTGFYCRTVLPTLNSNWTSGYGNQINLEYWCPINNGPGDWVEMGYHSGYGVDNFGNPDPYSFYSGLFSAYAIGFGADGTGNGYLKMRTYGSYGWAPNQTHTMGYLFNNDGSISLRSDNNTVYIYDSAYPPPDNSYSWLDVGMEWTTANGLTQSASLPISITDLNICQGSQWTPLSSLSHVDRNSHSGCTAIYNSSNNTITIK